MTRVDVQTLIQQYFNNPIYYQSIDINDSIQDGLDEICAFSGCVWKSTTLPFLNGKTYYDFMSLIEDYVGVFAIFNRVTKRWLFPTSLAKLKQTRIDWDSSGGTPSYFAPINFRYVAIFRKPLTNNYGNMEIFYVASAPALDDNVEIPIPGDHIQTLETYVECDLLEQNQEFSKAGLLQNDYLSNLNDLTKLVNARRNPARLPQLR